MFIDRAVIEVRSGKGGDGAIAFRREKFVDKGGPSGGNGGRGASVYLRANACVNTLFNFRHGICIIGKDGEKGGTKLKYGKGSEDVYVDVPLGTVVYLEDGRKFLGDLNEDGKTVAAVDMLVPGIGELCGGSQREERLDKLTTRIKELGLKEEDYTWYINTRRYGTNEHAGYGLGFERLIMYLTGVSNIRDVEIFPRTLGSIIG